MKASFELTPILAIAIAVAVAAGAAAAQEDGWTPLMECRFASACDTSDPECIDRELWYIIRFNPESESYTRFDALNKTVHDVTLTRHDRLLVFDGATETETPRISSHVERMVVAENGMASFQYAFFIEFDEDDWRFFSGENIGKCAEVTG